MTQTDACEFGGWDLVLEIPGAPVPKPRQTRADKWQRRPCVLRYRAFETFVRLRARSVGYAWQDGDAVLFKIGACASWSKGKRAALLGQPHRQRPDLDNLLKALLDALLPEDSGVADIGWMAKRWAAVPSVQVWRIKEKIHA